MITIKLHPMIGRDLDINATRVAKLSEAVSLMFRVMLRCRLVISIDARSVTLTDATNSMPLVQFNSSSGRDHREFRLLSQLAASFMRFREGEGDLALVRATFVNLSTNRLVPNINNMGRGSVGMMIVHLASWLVGRHLNDQVETDEDAVMLVNRLEDELNS